MNAKVWSRNLSRRGSEWRTRIEAPWKLQEGEGDYSWRWRSRNNMGDFTPTDESYMTCNCICVEISHRTNGSAFWEKLRRSRLSRSLRKKNVKEKVPNKKKSPHKWCEIDWGHGNEELPVGRQPLNTGVQLRATGTTEQGLKIQTSAGKDTSRRNCGAIGNVGWEMPRCNQAIGTRRGEATKFLCAIFPCAKILWAKFLCAKFL